MTLRCWLNDVNFCLQKKKIRTKLTVFMEEISSFPSSFILTQSKIIFLIVVELSKTMKKKKNKISYFFQQKMVDSWPNANIIYISSFFYRFFFRFSLDHTTNKNRSESQQRILFLYRYFVIQSGIEVMVNGLKQVYFQYFDIEHN